VNKQTAKLDS